MTRTVRTLAATLLAVVVSCGAGRAVAVTGPDQDLDTSASPWAVAIVADNGEGSRYLLCSGALVAPTVVVTAGHCAAGQVDLFLAGAIKVAVATGASSTVGDMAVHQVVSVAVHPGYRPGRSTSRDDIAVLVLAAPVDAATIAVAAPDAVGPFHAYGWGLNSDWHIDGKLGMAASRAATRRQLAGYPALAPKRQIAAVPAGPQTLCVGDSGGPLVTRGPQPTLVGLVSYGPSRCARGAVVFTRVSGYRAWIAEVTAPAAPPDPAASPAP